MDPADIFGRMHGSSAPHMVWHVDILISCMHRANLCSQVPSHRPFMSTDDILHACQVISGVGTEVARIGVAQCALRDCISVSTMLNMSQPGL